MTLKELVTRRRTMRSPSPSSLVAMTPLATLQREINRLFDELWKPRRDEGPRRAAELSHGATYQPNVEVRESNGQIEVFAELPGLNREDIDIALSPDGTTLTLRGEKNPENAEKDLSFLRTERRYGSFRRSIKLPSLVDADKVAATFHNGVLEVDLPKLDKGDRKMKHIEIKSA